MPLLEATVAVVCDNCNSEETVDMEWRYQSYSESSGYYDLDSTKGVLRRQGWYIKSQPDGESITLCEMCSPESDDEDEDYEE